MFEYRYMRMNMEGLLDGTDEVSAESISGAVSATGGKDPNKRYQMAPTSMSMSMHMLMGMVGLSPSLSAMVMGSYVTNKMDMAMNHGGVAGTGGHTGGHGGTGTSGAAVMTHQMETAGLGDTQVALSYAVSDPLWVSLAVSLPTGSTGEEVVMMQGLEKERASYGMQLGTGTVDLIPSATWEVTKGDHQWGLQTSYRYHVGENSWGYTLGNKIEASTWRKYQLYPGIWGSVRVVLINWGKIQGSDKDMDATMSPDLDTNAQGGTRADALAGLSGRIHRNFMLGFELGVPVYQNLNGPQMKTTLVANGSAQWMF